MTEESAAPEVTVEEKQEFNNVANVLSLIAKSSPTANSALGKMSDYAKTTGLNKTVEQPATTPATVIPETTTTTTPAATTTEITPANEEIEIEGLGKVSFATPNPVAPTEYKTPEEAIAALGKKMGIEFKSVNEFVEKADKAYTAHRTTAQKSGELEAKQKDISDTFAKMPDDLREGFLAWTKGEDYKQAFQNTGVNFNKPADQQDPQALVAQFFPNKFTAQDFEDHKTTPNPAIEIAVQASISQFGTIKSSREAAAKLNVDSQIAYKERFDASVDDSVSRITVELPFLTDKSAIESFKQDLGNLHLLRGTVLAKEFLKADGTLRADAGTRWALFKGGKALMDIHASKMSEIAASKAREEVVSKGADSPSQNGGHNVNPGNQTSEQKKVAQVNTFKTKKSVYS